MVAQDIGYSGNQLLRKLQAFFLSRGERKAKKALQGEYNCENLVPPGLFVKMWGHV